MEYQGRNITVHVAECVPYVENHTDLVIPPSWDDDDTVFFTSSCECKNGYVDFSYFMDAAYDDEFGGHFAEYYSSEHTHFDHGPWLFGENVICDRKSFCKTNYSP